MEFELIQHATINFGLNSDTSIYQKSMKIFSYEDLMKMFVRFGIDCESSFRKKCVD